jgi:signal transduction histidine kinase
MSGAHARLEPDRMGGSSTKSRGPLAHLLHALNQPLTGLQCSLELALMSPRPTEQYVRTLREGLELTGRMRILVQAVRELADLEQSDMDPSEEVEPVQLDVLLREAASDLLPVAESRGVHLRIEIEHSLPVRSNHRSMAKLLFRFLESALSLTHDGGEFRIVASIARGDAGFTAWWICGPLPEHSPFSRPELGLLIAQAGWEQAGAKWTCKREDAKQTCTVRLPLASSHSALQSCRVELT